MRIAITGKGGVGKTTITSILARALHDKGYYVITIDSDPNPNLAYSLGMNGNSQKVIPDLLSIPVADFENMSPYALIEHYASKTPFGIPLLIMGTVSQVDVGCLCKAFKQTRRILDAFEHEKKIFVLADMPASLEYLFRDTLKFIDTIIIVIEPYFKSLQTAIRIKNLAETLNIKHIYSIANKVRDRKDIDIIRNFLNNFGLQLLGSFSFDEKFISGGIFMQEESVKNVISKIEWDYQTKLLTNFIFALSEKILLSNIAELNQRELLAIRYLGQNGTMTMKQIANNVKAALSTTTALIDKLEQKKYVKRFSSPTDRRIVRVKLTEFGKSIYIQQMESLEKLVEQMTKFLNKHELSYFLKVFDKMQF